jgi:small-conductance mechanosensitive channel
VEEIQTRATIIKTYDGRRIVIPNADLFTHSVTINTALDKRRWEYDLNLKGVWNVEEVKSLLVSTLSKVQGVLADPKPEALVVDLTDPASNAVKVRVLWWTKAPRQHEMLDLLRQSLKCNRTGGNPCCIGPRARRLTLGIRDNLTVPSLVIPDPTGCNRGGQRESEERQSFFTLLTLLAAGSFAGCSPIPAKSSEVFDSIGKSLDQAGVQNLGRSLVC